MNDTRCPVCASDDYSVDIDELTGEPDYDGEKVCESCGEVWVL